MQVWPQNQDINDYRFVCKLVKSDKQNVYDFNKNKTLKELLNILRYQIKKDFKLNLNFKLLYRKSYSRNGLIILENSNDTLIKKFNNNNYVKLEIKPDYMYSLPEYTFANRRDRISYLIKIDAVKIIQKFYRDCYKKECPCCLSELTLTTKYYNCDHLICNKCFTEWSKVKQTCPCCRTAIKPYWYRYIRENLISYQNIDDELPILTENERSTYDWFSLISLASELSSRYSTNNDPTNTPRINTPTTNTNTNINSIINYSYSNRTIPDQILINNLNTLQNTSEMMELVEDLNST